MKAAREDGFKDQDALDPDKLVFLDETAANTKMARRYGRAPRGARCRIDVPPSLWSGVSASFPVS